MRRIIIVSNRLPFTAHRKEGAWEFIESVGGLATGLSAFLESLGPDAEYLWVGWPGSTVVDAEQEELRAIALERYRSVPVFLAEEDVENFYQGFCNKTIWPLFHYFPEYAEYRSDFWAQYEKVNAVFCRTIASVVRPGDLVWVHDYHLMLLPKMLKDEGAGTPIGFFLHIPFPTYEIFRLMPAEWRVRILEGLLGADLIGFHTFDYMQYFLRCVLRLLGLEHSMGNLVVGDRLLKAGTFPMGIDFLKFREAATNPASRAEQVEVRGSLGPGKIVLSVDRLDYSKGIINRLEGFELLLTQHEEWRGNVSLVVILVPSRVGLGTYDLMKKQIEEQIGRINGKFATMEWTPIRYQYKALSFAPLVALYAASDVALITPLRDGMNLIAKEYVASRREQNGVLVLSEMAGAAKELGEAIIINPNSRQEIAAALHEALRMPEDEQARRIGIMQNRLRRYNVVRWATDFLDELSAATLAFQDFTAKLVAPAVRDRIINVYRRADRRLLLLDYDGTLVGFSRRPGEAKPTQEVLDLLCRLAENPKNRTVLISGRRKDDLDGWFGWMDIGLAAEHGAWIRDHKGEWKLLRQMSNDWKAKIAPILEMYADRLPGAFVEEKDYSLAWHYRIPDPDHGEQMARELTDELFAFTANIDVQVLQGSKVVEIRNAGVNKGAAAKRWLAEEPYGFLLAIGDDWTDEDLFAAMPEPSFSIRVGFSKTRAAYQLRTPRDVVQFLQQLAG